MSHEVVTPAYKTRLGNATAKSVLALLANSANSDGYGWPSVQRIAEDTELSERTVMRIVQVFVGIGLITKVWRGKRKTFGIQVALEKLGMDMTQEFARAYAEAQRKDAGSPGGKCRRDSEEDVAETLFSVSETPKSVAETLPPHPLIGGTVIEPSRNLPPVVPQRGSTARTANVSADRLANALAVERAVDQVCSALAIANQRKRKLLRNVIELEAEKGNPPPTIALDIIAAVREQGVLHARSQLKFKFGLNAFLGDGIWKNKNLWAWDNEETKRRAEACVGSYKG